MPPVHLRPHARISVARLPHAHCRSVHSAAQSASCRGRRRACESPTPTSARPACRRRARIDVGRQPRRGGDLVVELSRSPAGVAGDEPRARTDSARSASAARAPTWRGTRRRRPARRCRRARGSLHQDPAALGLDRAANPHFDSCSVAESGSSCGDDASRRRDGTVQRRARTRPRSLCWHSSTTVRSKFGSSSCGIESSSVGARVGSVMVDHTAQADVRRFLTSAPQFRPGADVCAFRHVPPTDVQTRSARRGARGPSARALPPRGP